MAIFLFYYYYFFKVDKELTKQKHREEAFTTLVEFESGRSRTFNKSKEMEFKAASSIFLFSICFLLFHSLSGAWA